MNEPFWINFYYFAIQNNDLNFSSICNQPLFLIFLSLSLFSLVIYAEYLLVFNLRLKYGFGFFLAVFNTKKQV